MKKKREGHTARRVIWPVSWAIFLTAFTAGAVRPNTQGTDVWEPLKFLIGAWEGTGKGEPGTSRVEREYQFVLEGKYINVRNRSTYAPQEKNPKGERHEDWALLSFDKARQQFVLRQFHSEGFVSLYVMQPPASSAKTLVFQTESIENIPAGWRARETYRIISNDEFIEVFELAAPGKEFEIYTENHLKRKGPSTLSRFHHNSKGETQRCQMKS